MSELIPRIATALHKLNHTMEALLAGAPASAPPTEISKTTKSDSATDFVHHLEGQKGILCQVRLVVFETEISCYPRHLPQPCLPLNARLDDIDQLKLKQESIIFRKTMKC